MAVIEHERNNSSPLEKQPVSANCSLKITSANVGLLKEKANRH